MNKKVILITGASSGIGKTTALQLIEEGHVVFGAARRVDKMQDIVDKGGQALAMDVTKEDQIKSAVNQIISAHGKIDVLINNAGFGMYGAMEDTTLEDARYQFEVNIFGLAAVTKEVLPHMRKVQAGKIINISSMGGKMYTPLGSWYHATKHALEGWSDCLRIEVKQFGIDVVIIEPGIINTEFGDVMLQPMMERSGTGPYAALAKGIEKATTQAYEKNAGSDPSVIANAISKAIAAKKPKTRYRTGKFAKLLVNMRLYLGDRAFDNGVMKQFQ